ncbi:glutaredoxin 2 [Vreelandella titanicae]|uniref:Glutaredoxin 2 n=1 Tax=Vreelandella titanicae TaxID=664683 RepID=A0A558JF32_9GAMM|nr:glutaredoxin 2 [Halomonas titanicae]TVU92243.1 glutaredoxin 2 [Halomonas titanicae]
MKLYVYDHCPFCVRARMIFGLKNIPCEIVFLANDDETTPQTLIGKKMLPILVTDEGEIIGESLDIVRYIDAITGKPTLSDPASTVEAWIEEVSRLIYQLAIPRWSYSDYPEFKNESARTYFTQKKENVFGSFSTLMKESPALIKAVNIKLIDLDQILAALPTTERYSLTDILLYPVLRSLSIVKGVEWPVGLDAWRKRVATDCRVPLNDAIAI